MAKKNKSIGSNVIRFLEKIEDGLLIALLLLMIFMAVLQILLRNLFDSGILWGDPLIRILVLWIGLIGAMIASRDNHHISIDVISRYLPRQVKKASSLVLSVFTATVSGTMAYFSLMFVQMEKLDGQIAFANIPAWVCESIIPFAFTIICLRYIVSSFQTLKDLFSRTAQ